MVTHVNKQLQFRVTSVIRSGGNEKWHLSSVLEDGLELIWVERTACTKCQNGWCVWRNASCLVYVGLCGMGLDVCVPVCGCWLLRRWNLLRVLVWAMCGITVRTLKLPNWCVMNGSPVCQRASTHQPVEPGDIGTPRWFLLTLIK